MSDSCVWLYTVLPADSADRVDTPRGVDGERVRTVRGGELAALVGDVGGERFGSRALARNLERLDWLAEVARAHDAVVRTAAARGGVVPVRLATVFQDDDAVRALLVERRAEFVDVLEALTGRAEWGVKAYANPDAWAKAEVGAGEDSAGLAGEGSMYLMRRRAQLTARRRAEDEAARWSRAAHARLCELCTASRMHQPQNPQLSGRVAPMILNASYLVDQARVEDLRALVDELARQHEGLDVELTGPWPPYSFTALAGAHHG